LLATDCPQEVQKLVPGCSFAPHPVQNAGLAAGAATAGMRWPQEVQKLEEAATSLPHEEQTAMASSCAWVIAAQSC
jgi:hypothetical protein